MTSHDLVAGVRREREGAKVGHAGTLDPFATGLLIVLVGTATKAQQVLMRQRKRYIVTARFGAVSDTGDRDGTITETGTRIPDHLELPEGEIVQTPPAYSAIKVGGERAHRRARRGEEVAMPPRIVTVHSFRELSRAGQEATFEIECSSGTYVRTLIGDLGDAYCTELRRTSIGPFSVDEAPGELALEQAIARLDPADAEKLR
jgi:tRNA pseudouridine55 synthase